jgi:HEPN domain-containing protein
MKRHTAQWVTKAEEDIESARELSGHRPPRRNAACFHCQQAVEKYLKALLQEVGAVVPRTHNLKELIDLLIPHYPALKAIRRSTQALTKYAVEYRYPGMSATLRQMTSALRIAERARTQLRNRLGLPG